MPPNSAQTSPRRQLCKRCLRPASTCICGTAREVDLHTEVLILMHPDEVGHAKNTGQLLRLCLPGSRVLIGERFEDALLQSALFDAWNGQPSPNRTVLLYPGEDSHPHTSHSPSIRIRLVLIDATWRQSRQMVSAHPRLQSLPRIALQDTPATRYAIRKAHEPHQLSTLEAARLALDLLEPGRGPQIALLDQAMDAFVSYQRKFWPHARQIEK
ncbi:DTW domain-containing protein [Diaphorobacter sp. HDW4A]|uniref:tRNA-uridine aminocarboxypropyltransferase n=1 Tax=Diaphorobacter sp. HDW4A TaxID=2714924 RepID=UPI00140E19BA|nr:tRNA-uridine aminocarboxypropyltransferase [Diaphorobacter sp. HDW4A]QIL79884.1 DTW domain-containing protein [Diaphorobacter sp. HDW4A]